MDDGDALATLIEKELQDTEGPETSLIPEADTETQVEKALDEKDVDFDLEMTEPETEEASEERITDPVIEAYIRENADPKYVSGDDMKLRNMLYVENTLADASMLEPDDTVSSVMSAENNGEIVWYVSETDVAVYSLSEDDDYWVAFADTMHDDPTAMAMDGVFALTNYDGEVVALTRTPVLLIFQRMPILMKMVLTMFMRFSARFCRLWISRRKWQLRLHPWFP